MHFALSIFKEFLLGVELHGEFLRWMLEALQRFLSSLDAGFLTGRPWNLNTFLAKNKIKFFELFFELFWTEREGFEFRLILFTALVVLKL